MSEIWVLEKKIPKGFTNYLLKEREEERLLKEKKWEREKGREEK